METNWITWTQIKKLFLIVQNPIQAQLSQVLFRVKELTGCIYKFQLRQQSNGCETHTDRHKYGWNLYWLCYIYVINIH